MANCVETAKKIRAGLKEKFPHTKFSVRSSRYSGGSSVYVSWTDFPHSSMVNEYIKQFEKVDRCEYSGEILSGGNMYISGSNDWTPETRAMIEARAKEKYSEETLKDWYWSNKAFTEAANEIYNEMYNTKETNKEETKETNTYNNSEAVTATYSLNDEHNGIEIKFSGKPAAGTIALLKENGFKWHNTKKVWFAKQTQERLFFVDAICSTLNDIAQTEEVESAQNEVETVEVEQVEEIAQVEEVKETIRKDGEKVKVKEIKFLWSESGLVKDGQTVSTFAEAEEIILNIAYNKDTQGYDKTAFLISWEDGQTYEGRIDVLASYRHKKAPLKDHIEHFNLGLIGERKPAHMTDNDYKNLLNAYGMTEEKQEEIRQFLSTYALEDITEPEPEPTKQSEPETVSNVLDFAQFKNKKTTNNSNITASCDNMTPEQQFKKLILIELFGEQNYEEGIKAFGNVDELFKISAEVALIYKAEQATK